MPVNYAKSTGGKEVVTVTIDPENDLVPVTQTTPARVPPTVGVYADIDMMPEQPDPIFYALLSGEVANRGIQWYANTTPSTLAHRVGLLKKTAKEIRNAFYASVTTH